MPRLRNRLLTAMTGLTTGFVLLSGLTTYMVIQSSLRRNLDESLLVLARTELASARDKGFVHVHETDPRTLSVAGVPGYEKYVWIVDDAHRMVARTANMDAKTVIEGADPFETIARTRRTLFGDIRIDREKVRAVFYAFESPDGRRFVGAIGIPLNVVDDTIGSVGRIIFLVGLACLVLTFLIVSIVARSLSKPLEELATAAERIDPSHPQPRALESPYDEINGLASAMNGLTTRVAKMLAERNRVIDGQRQFIADASHELRTPVSNIQGTIEVALRRQRTCPEYKESLALSLGEAQRIGRLIDDLLSLAKTDVGGFNIRCVPSDLTAIVHQAIASLGYLPEATEISVGGQERLMASVDPDRVRQAVDNLLGNAIAHAASRVKVHLEADHDQAVVTVSNDGPELSPGEERLVFDRFYRSDQSRSRHTGGTGLGLAIVRSIAEAHGGRVSAKSADGCTTFTMAVPIGGPK